MAKGVVGTCKWCGGTDVKKPAIYWHPKCVDEYRCHTELAFQYDFLVERDGERCAKCRSRSRGWARIDVSLRATTAYRGFDFDDLDDSCFWTAPEWRWRPGLEYPEEQRVFGAYCRLKRVILLEVDHRVPLWSVAHLPDDERRPYFGPLNLWLLCPRCHKAKTRREAAERARQRREKR